MKRLKILYKEPYKPLEVREVDNNLDTFQKLVGGYVEAVRMHHGIIMLCDEEGLYKNLEPNIAYAHSLIMGNVVFVSGDGGEDFASITDIQEAWLRKQFL